MRPTFAAALLLAASLSLAGAPHLQGLAAHVSFTSRAGRASQVLKALSKAAKVELLASSQMTDEIVLISVNDVPLPDLMDRIAKVTSGEWRQEGSSYRLVSNPAVRRQQEREAMARRLAVVKNVLAKRERLLNLQEGHAPSAEDGEMVITRMLERIDPKELAQMERGDRIVFANNPTPVQWSLDDNVLPLVEQWAKANANRGFIQHTTTIFDEVGNIYTGHFGDANAILDGAKPASKGPPAKTLLIAERPTADLDSAIDVELRVYDAKGAVSVNLKTTLHPDPDAVATPNTNDQRVHTTTPIAYSEDSKALQVACDSIATNGHTLLLSPAFKHKLFQPDVDDPLSYMTTDELLAYAKSAGKPIVASPPDWCGFGLTRLLQNHVPTVEELAEDINRGKILKLIPDDKFVTLMPAEPVDARAFRTDRDALALLLHAAETKLIPSLDDFTAFAERSSAPLMGGIADMYLFMFIPGGDEFRGSFSSWDMLRLYGSLSPEARSSLESGRGLAIGNLTAIQRSLVEKLVYGAPAKAELFDPSKPLPSPEAVYHAFLNPPEDYQTEPTEAAPNGLPPAGMIALRKSIESFASPLGVEATDQLASAVIQTADELGAERAMRDNKGARSGDDHLVAYSKLRIGEMARLNFTIHISPMTVVRQRLTDCRLSKDSAVYAANELPADFQRRINAGYEAFKKAPFGIPGLTLVSGDANPPPPN